MPWYRPTICPKASRFPSRAADTNTASLNPVRKADITLVMAAPVEVTASKTDAGIRPDKKCRTGATMSESSEGPLHCRLHHGGLVGKLQGHVRPAGHPAAAAYDRGPA